MKLLSSMIILFILFSIDIRAQQAQKSRCKTQVEYKQFDFWVGEWEVKNPNGDIVGNSKIERTVGECVILESWSGNSGYTGKSLNYYSMLDQKWHQKWVGSDGIPIEFSGNYDSKTKSMNYTGKGIGQGGIKFDYKLTFYHITDVHIRQHWEQSSDGGEKWTTIFDGHYRKKSN